MLLSLLNKLRKRDNMQNLPSILSFSTASFICLEFEINHIYVQLDSRGNLRFYLSDNQMALILI